MARRTLTDAEKKARDDERAANFVKLANKRTQAALDAIAKLRGLGASNYVSTPEQRAKIIQALEAGVMQVSKSFEGKAEATGFQL